LQTIANKRDGNWVVMTESIASFADFVAKEFTSAMPTNAL
jgi:hypothetical protein